MINNSFQREDLLVLGTPARDFIRGLAAEESGPSFPRLPPKPTPPRLLPPPADRSPEPIAIVRKVYGALAARDLATLRTVGETALDPLIAVWDQWDFEAGEYIAQGSSVVVLGTYRGRAKHTGAAFRAAAVHVFTLKDGKVRRFRQLTDAAQILKAAA